MKIVKVIIFAQTSVRPFLKLFTDIPYPLPRLSLNEYKAGYFGKKVFYIIIPKISKKEKQEEIKE